MTTPRAFKRLCELTAEMIDKDKISNPELRNIVKILTSGSPYMFSKGKWHNDSHTDRFQWRRGTHTDESFGGGESTGDDSDSSYSGHTDEFVPGQSDHIDDHTDHNDHTDYTESKHDDNNYVELPNYKDCRHHIDKTTTTHIDK